MREQFRPWGAEEKGRLKPHLVGILFREYEQLWTAELMANVGVEVTWSNLSPGDYPLWDAALGLIGFPDDNSTEYDLMGDRQDKKPVDDDLFCRDNLQEPYYRITEDLIRRPVTISPEGVTQTRASTEPYVKKQLAEYVDWLFDEHRKWYDGRVGERT